MPYLLKDVQLGARLTLTIPAGTIIKFVYHPENTRKVLFIVYGTLDLQSTSGNPIVFTSERDDSYGGDTNNDGNTTSPASGDWGCIQLNSQPGVSNNFHDCIVRYGGNYYNGGVNYSYMLWIKSIDPSYNDAIVQNCSFSDSYGPAIYISDQAKPTIMNNSVIHSRISMNIQRDAIISGNTITGLDYSGTGITIASNESNQVVHPTINNNIIENFSYPFEQVDCAFPSYSGNTIINNKYHVGTATFIRTVS